MLLVPPRMASGDMKFSVPTCTTHSERTKYKHTCSVSECARTPPDRHHVQQHRQASKVAACTTSCVGCRKPCGCHITQGSTCVTPVAACTPHL